MKRLTALPNRPQPMRMVGSRSPSVSYTHLDVYKRQRFYLSPYYLSRLFRRVTGQSIVDYINGRRIEAAQRLLESTDLNISAVAEQTGFASAAHFRRVFRETMGTGPLQYRKSHRG